MARPSSGGPRELRDVWRSRSTVDMSTVEKTRTPSRRVEAAAWPSGTAVAGLRVGPLRRAERRSSLMARRAVGHRSTGTEPVTARADTGPNRPMRSARRRMSWVVPEARHANSNGAARRRCYNTRTRRLSIDRLLDAGARALAIRIPAVIRITAARSDPICVSSLT